MSTVTLTPAISDPALAVQIALTYTEAIALPRLALTGAQTYAIDLAMMTSAGLHGFYVALDKTDAAGAAVPPATLRWTENGVQTDHELGPGGAYMIANPAPTHSITALSIVTTGNAVLHLYAWG